MSEPKYTNALAGETSPYLLQHAHNPVQWYPWSQEALGKARDEDKPILLSIGYSACHWCHVMEHECFENEEIAALMNELFVNIKVDREERPDLDAIYMQAVQLMTGRGGWPTTVFLTPDQVPFYGGTYYPPEDRHGIPGFPRVLRSIAQAYRDKKAEIRTDAARIVQELQRNNTLPGEPGELSVNILDKACVALLSVFDTQNGGFGSAPKFPPSMTLDFLMRSYARTGSVRYLEAVERTLQRMAHGGIYDQLGGGFHRYSVDSYWRVPHFEKMLYDNALLSRVYLDAFLLTGNPLYRNVVEETLNWVMRELVAPDGGIYGTLDADSDGVEGKYYLWQRREVEDLLGGEDAELFCRYFGVTEEGDLDGKSVLHVPRASGLVARLNNLSEEELVQRIARCRQALLAARAARVRPARDEKILVAWNGLMLRSFAEAAGRLGREEYGAVAVRCAEFLLARLQLRGHLRHCYKDGEAKVDGFLEDYACLADGLLALYELDFDERWLRETIRLCDRLLDLFQDPGGAGFFLTSRDQQGLITRPKDFYDNATPSGNSVAVLVLLRLATITGDHRWSRPALELLQGLAPIMARHPAAFGNLLCGLDFALSDTIEIAIAGHPQQSETHSLLQEVFHRYLPNKVVVCGVDSGLFLLKDRRQVSGRPAAYVCKRGACQAPTCSASDLAAQLDQFGRHPSGHARG